jgi:3-carboxy-cis,cis-muconate cycloisomerase
VASSVALAASLRAPGLVATMLASLPQEHERGLGGWQAEWTTLPELVVVTAGASRAMAESLEGLQVQPARMRQNVDLTRGLVLAEAVTMTLAVRMGKTEAHARVEEASRRAVREGLPLAQALADDREVARYMARDEIEERLRPETYLGAAAALIARVLSRR